MSLADGVRLAIGTFTIVPVRPPLVVTAGEARIAIMCAPLLGALLGTVAGVVLWAADTLGGGALLGAALAVAALAALTRGIHLDGLADVADGLGSGHDAAAALAVMRRPDIGAFGALTLVLAVVLQIVALAQAQQLHVGPAALVLAVVTGRVAIVIACVPGVPPARQDGLGAAVAGTVPSLAAAIWVAALLAVAAWGTGSTSAAVSSLAGLLVAMLMLNHCVRRLGGVTGDVLGAVNETATTAALILAALAPPW